MANTPATQAASLPAPGVLFAALLGLQAALPPLSIDISLPALPDTGQALGADAGELQASLSGFLAGFAGGQLLIGPLADRFGRRTTLLWGLVLFVLAGAGCAFAGSAAVLTACRVLQGIGACAGMVTSRATVRDMYAGDRAAAIQSVLSVVSTCAMLAAPILGGLILAVAGWRAVYGVLPLAGLALMALSIRFVPETRPGGIASGSLIAGYRAAVSNRQVVAYTLVNALVFGGLFAFISGSPAVLIGELGIDPLLFGWLFAVPAAAMLLGAALSGRLAPRLGAPVVRRIGWAVLAVAIPLLCLRAALGGSVPTLLAVLACFAFAAGSVMPGAVAAAMAPLPGAAGVTAGLIGALQFATGAGTAALVGLVAPGTAWGMLTVMAALAGLGLLIGLACEAGLRRPVRTPAGGR